MTGDGGQSPPPEPAGASWRGQRLGAGSGSGSIGETAELVDRKNRTTSPSSILDGGRFWNNNTNNTSTLAALPSLGACVKTTLGMTIALYVLNEQKLLPRPISAVVSKVLFWPSMPITVSKRIGKWISVVDDTVIMGGAPFGFANLPQDLHDEYGVRGVVNLCAEYRGPDRMYRKLGMRQLWLPTNDHFEPSLSDLERAVQFISQHEKMGKKVYVHCRAGHGRSAAVVYAWLLSKQPDTNLQQLNQRLCKIRNVRKTLWKQKNIIRFHSRLQNTEKLKDNAIDEDLESEL